jgi:alpha-beta hydrolase superfamily lysophospholipase
MNAAGKRRIGRILIVLIAIYVTGGIALYFFQDRILFHPKALARDHRFSFDQPFEEINIQVDNSNLNIVKFTPTNKATGIVLFYHGNMENVEHYKNYPPFFTTNGYELWMMDYPGFGKSTGELSEKLIEKEALTVYDLACKRISSDSIIIYGKSIGTGVAAYVAANRNCTQLILETPYYSISSLAEHYFPIYPAGSMIKYSFAVNEYVKKVEAPITIFHGTNDEVVPYKQSTRLKQENQKIKLITIEEGHHNNLSSFKRFKTTLDSLLQD